MFHHLDAGDRKHIAAAGGRIAVVWEDNRSGGPKVYLAVKDDKARSFSTAQIVSGEGAAFEPVVIALEKNRFVVGWEENETARLRVLQDDRLGPVIELARKSGQLSLAAMDEDRIVAVWSERAGRHRQVQLARVRLGKSGDEPKAETARAVDPKPPAADQQYPTVVAVGEAVTVAWEDRRRGHTVLYYTHAADGGRFASPKALNEVPPRRSEIYGKGTGVMRASLVRHGEKGVAASWLDKRELAVGYDVYAGFSADRGARFGRNEKVQDEFANGFRHWHAAIAATGKGEVAVTWDDHRDGTTDVWLSWRGPGGWSDDLAVPGASGPGEQDSPAIAFDESGGVHLIWLEREESGAPTRLRYAHGRRANP